MFSKAAVLSIVAGVVAAQSSIPSGISNDCSTFLQQLNQNTGLQSCTKSLLSSTQSFDPASANAQSTQQALTAFCSASTSCDEGAIRSALSDFYGKCSAELAGGANKDVTTLYDTFYALVPLKQAMCSKADDGSLCATAGSSNSVPLVNGQSVPAQQVLQSMGTTSPNATTFAQTNLLFMFLNPKTSSLCSSCTRNVMSAYMQFETKTSYGPGFKSSSLLAGQSDLYDEITKTCGSNFLQGQLQAAGSLSGGSSNGAGEAKVISGALATAVAALVAFATL